MRIVALVVLAMAAAWPSLAWLPPPDKTSLMLFFAADSAELNAKTLNDLERMARDAKGSYDGAISVTGHADDGEVDPPGVSKARAEAIKGVLVNLGIDPSRISVGQGTVPAPENYPPESVSFIRRSALIEIEKRCRPNCPLPEYQDSGH